MAPDPMLGFGASDRSVGAPAALVGRLVPARQLVMLAVAAGLGLGVPLSGFNPVNSAPDALGMAQQPILVLLTPAVLLGILALVGAATAPASRSWPREVRILAAGAGLLVLGVVLSLSSTDDLWYSILIGSTAVLAPVAVAVGVACSAVSPRAISACLLVACCVLLARADLIFLQLHGLPSPATLYELKYLNRAYDFHYYTLGNPNSTAAWLIMPFALALFWAVGTVSLRSRAALIAATGLVGITLVLAYSRAALAVGILLVIGALLVLPLGKTMRYGIAGAFIAVVTAFALAPTNREYLSKMVSFDPLSSGRERYTSLIDGIEVALDHPFTGVGLGRYNVETGNIPAHSSVVQAAAEMGLLGAIGLSLLVIGSVMLAIRTVRARGPGHIRAAAAIAAATYLVFSVLVAGAHEGLYSGYVSVWGLTLALLLGLAAGDDVSEVDRGSRQARTASSGRTWRPRTNM